LDILLLKLIITPALIGGASLASRRWGPEIGGWLVGIPFTSGPVTFFLALSYGEQFASAAAISIYAGALSQIAFCFGYAWTARHGLLLAMVAGTFCFALITLGLNAGPLPVIVLAPLVIAVLFLSNLFFPKGRQAQKAPMQNPPAWDIPLRMFITTALVLLLTGLAPLLGSRLTGLLTPFPIYASIMALFAHRLHGPAAAVRVLHGLLLGLFAFAGFFLVLAFTIVPFGVLPAFALAILTALAIQAVSFLILRDRRRKYEPLASGFE
jgi:hypothetical protein